jgi:hypothetical protein
LMRPETVAREHIELLRRVPRCPRSPRRAARLLLLSKWWLARVRCAEWP